MRKQTLPVAFELLECYVIEFRELFKEIIKSDFPKDQDLTTTDFEKNETFFQLRHVINEKLGSSAFHPKKLYTYVFQYFRRKNETEFDRLQKHKEGAVFWNITSSFPKMLFMLLGYEGLEDFLDKNHDKIGDKVIQRQRTYIEEYYLSRNRSSVKILGLFHCYVSNLEGFRIGKMAIYDNDEVELVINDAYVSFYKGVLRQNDNWLTMDFEKVKKGVPLKNSKKTQAAHEVSFKFLQWKDFDQHIFIFGTYSAINRNDYIIQNPARVAGPIILEWVDPAEYDNTNLSSLPFMDHEQVDPIIAAKVSNNRLEENRTYSRRSSAPTFAERRKEELAYIDKHNTLIKKPEACIGKYICLIYSKTHHALRKLIVEVKNDLTVMIEATKYHNQQVKIHYEGKVTSFADGLFTFRADKGVRQDYLQGVFLCKSIRKPIYGLIDGIFKDMPKAGRAILIPNSEELTRITGNSCSCFIDIDSKTYRQLDDLYAITAFYAGVKIEQERLDSSLIMNDSIAIFRQLLLQKRGDFEKLKGLYEEYYYDHDRELLRKDYLLIQPNGCAYMIGTYRYEGMVTNLGAKFLIDFRSVGMEKKPLIYLLHNDSSDHQMTSGIFATVTENNREIVGNAAYLHQVSRDVMDKKAFFEKHGEAIEKIPLNTERFHKVNAELNFLGSHLAGKIENVIVSRNLEKSDGSKSNSRDIAYSFFYAACFLASKDKLKVKMEAVRQLNLAFKNGFSDRILLEQEMREGNALYSIREMIDVECFRTQDDLKHREVG